MELVHFPYGILIKFCIDNIPTAVSIDEPSPFLYGMNRRRNDLAMKSAGHEMLGNSLILLQRNHLTFLGLTYLMCKEYLILKKNKRKVTDTG